MFWGDLFSYESYKYKEGFYSHFTDEKLRMGVGGRCPARITELRSDGYRIKPGFLIPRPQLAFHQLHTLKVKPAVSLPIHKPLKTYFKSAL